MTSPKKHDVLISMPSHRGVPEHETHMCLSQAMQYMASKGLTVAFNPVVGSNLARNRNTGVDEAMSAQAKFLMFVDDDMIFDPEWIERLMSHNKPVVTGLTVKKFWPHVPNVRRFGDDGKLSKTPDLHKGGLVRIDACGTGFMCVKMSVFEGMKKPYFCFPPTGHGTVEGEDYYFCGKVRDKGMGIWADMDMHVGHLGKYPFSIRDHLQVIEQEAQQKRAELSRGENGNGRIKVVSA